MCKITKDMVGKPIGMFHCPIKGWMVLPSSVCCREDECDSVIK